MIKVLAEVWIHSNAETGEPYEVCINGIKADDFIPFDLLRFISDSGFDDRIDEFTFLHLDEWHNVELYFNYDDGWFFDCAKNIILTQKVPQEPNVVQRFIDIEVYHEDAPNKMTWDEAVTWCQALGDGWRLPDRQELLAMYEQRNILGDFWSDSYWSSSVGTSSFAWLQDFGNGRQVCYYKNYYCRVRAVRDREAGK